MKTRRGMTLMIVVLSISLLLSACGTPAAPAQPTPTPTSPTTSESAIHTKDRLDMRGLLSCSQSAKSSVTCARRDGFPWLLMILVVAKKTVLVGPTFLGAWSGEPRRVRECTRELRACTTCSGGPSIAADAARLWAVPWKPTTPGGPGG